MDRILAVPPIGLATEHDLLAIRAKDGRICELIDGVLVEKAVGYLESRLAMLIGFYIQMYLKSNNLGSVTGEAGFMKLSENQVRAPDVAFCSWSQFPDRRMPNDPIPALVPDLAVEILSKSNSPAEIQRKVREYFAAGTKLVWVMDPQQLQAKVHTSADDALTLGSNDVLNGGSVLPGFQLQLRTLFAELGVE